MRVAILALIGLTACTVTEPVAVIGTRGDVLTGFAKASMSSGTMTAANIQISCSGTYDPLDTDRVLTFAVICTNGLHGIGSAMRSASGMAGQGQVHLDNGATANFIYGDAAANFTPKVGGGLIP